MSAEPDSPPAAMAVPAPAAKSEDTAPPSVAVTTASNVDDDFSMPGEGLEQFSATVINIMKRPYGEMVILLNNGQIWEQKHRYNGFRLKV